MRALPRSLIPVAAGLGLAAAVNAGCRGERASGIPDARTPDARPPFVPAMVAKDRAAQLAALSLRHERIRAGLGAHRVGSRSRLTTAVAGRAERSVHVTVQLTVDAKGQFAATKNTDPQSGTEVVYAGGRLYSRLRHSKFLRRPVIPVEALADRERLYGSLPAYVGLLGRFMRIETAGRKRHQGREAVVLKLSLAAKAGPAARPRGPAGKWRRSISVKRLTGRALIDLASGAPLSVQLEARWSFAMGTGPDKTGIPAKLDPKRRGTMSLVFSQQVTEVGEIAPIEPPAEEEVVAEPRRIRREIERQMLTGERPLQPRWRQKNADPR